MTQGSSLFGRKSVIYFIIVAFFALLVLRLFQMQILEYQFYNEKSANNSIKAIEQIPLRGVFYDRNMNVVVSNVPAYTLRIIPAEYNRKLNSTLEAVLGEKPGYINKILSENKIYSRYIPVRIKRGIDFKVVSWLEENAEHLPGVDYIVEMQRDYPAGIRGSHIFGYTKEISPKLLEKYKGLYEPGDFIGYTGIEKAYESILKGKKGYKYVLVNAHRRETGEFKDGKDDVPSVKGNDLVLTIDSDVQRVAEQALKGYRGAAVAIEPKTGEILAMASAPDYDLSEFSYVTSREYLNKLYTDPAKPFFNRATQSANPPGSTFKIMEAICALNNHIIDTNFTTTCTGGQTFFGRYFKCDARHGTLNVIHAIEHSCNVFFYNLIYKIGMEKWHEYAKLFGFGQDTHIDIDDEVKGLIPSSQYYVKRYGENWPKSIMASLGIGQGEVNVTPIQLAQYAALIANDGVTYTPHLVRGYLTNDTKKLVPFSFKRIDLGIDKKIFNIVKEGMYLVVNGSGTAAGIKSKTIEIAGKTGTAQNPHGKDHAWFICFAPYNNPKIAVAVLVENVGFGATYAAPIAKKMVEAYLEKDKLKNEEQNPANSFDNKLMGAKLEN
ncbi:MAG TPA: penicillin-binding protein 2 [Ignavibacteriaceae bacterium]|nr:penicillin-binding protein 2 [Ignavibacteriaceae bacterium]